MKISEIVRQMNPPRYTITEAAGRVGRDKDTLRRWKRNGILVPSDSRKFGKTTVGLYTDEDVEKGKALTKELKPGPKATEKAS